VPVSQILSAIRSKPTPIRKNGSFGFRTNYSLACNLFPSGEIEGASQSVARNMMLFVQGKSRGNRPNMKSVCALNYMLWDQRETYDHPDKLQDEWKPLGIFAAATPTPATMDPNGATSTYSVHVDGQVETHHVWHHQEDQQLCPDVSSPTISVGFLLRWVDLTPSTIVDVIRAKNLSSDDTTPVMEEKYDDESMVLPRAGSKRKAPATASARPTSRARADYDVDHFTKKNMCMQLVPYACPYSVVPDYTVRFDYEQGMLMPCFYMGRTVSQRGNANTADRNGDLVRRYVFPRNPTDHIDGTNELPVMTLFMTPLRRGMQWVC
jgi:hypothetical protein